jgi:hypothetical protein
MTGVGMTGWGSPSLSSTPYTHGSIARVNSTP